MEELTPDLMARLQLSLTKIMMTSNRYNPVRIAMEANDYAECDSYGHNTYKLGVYGFMTLTSLDIVYHFPCHDHSNGYSRVLY